MGSGGIHFWTKTSVAYHLYNNDSAYGAATNAANLRNLHSRFPAWPSENNFPSSVSSAALGITDDWRSAQFDSDVYVNQTCERLGLGWSMWNINGQTQLDRNWPIMIADANAKGWNWTADVLPPNPPVFTSSTSAVLSQNIATSIQLTATGGTITYASEWSDDLSDWHPVTNTGTAPQHTFSVFTAVDTRLFLRLKVTAP